MNLTDPSELRAFLARHGIFAAKGLGQHFLCSGKVAEAIRLRLAGMRGLLEIGPGPGILTSVLSSNGERMIALEVDARMLPALAESAPTAEVRLGDALEQDLAAILGELPSPRGVVSNLPYYITGPLLTRIAEAASNWDKAVLMMQREVATRILALPGNSERGSLSIYLQAQFAIEKVCDVPPGAFLPPPKVESTVLELVPLRTAFEPGFFDFVRAGFKQPRKTLANNLVASGMGREEATIRLERAGLDERVRPHMLSLAEWQSVAQRPLEC
ncbi:MAG TPA: 16S rRNA (adenine(1518)-N(6)/adenine(1519)-N(6))-dimethyltransferase RsmA [Fimbriimonadaceae bacterium]|nr:16S rRNA (adenine(1518)-N(6)/adenine(1519)-N(6))-dimethyltransferase RsmA [Fimbriimonadaceae bacterium]